MYGAEGLVVLGLLSGSRADAADLDAFLDATGATFPILIDTADTYSEYDNVGAISPYPIDLVIDADGTIVYLARTYEPAALRAAVESVLP